MGGHDALQELSHDSDSHHEFYLLQRPCSTNLEKLRFFNKAFGKTRVSSIFRALIELILHKKAQSAGEPQT